MSMTSSRSYLTYALYQWIIDNDCTPYILVDAERPGVEVPQEFVSDGQIVLNISPTAVIGLDINPKALMFEGKFGGQALTITVPIPALMAIYAQENGQGMAFEDEIAEIEPEEGAKTDNKPLEKEPSKPSKKSGAFSFKSHKIATRSGDPKRACQST